jgi:hypothetical protein
MQLLESLASAYHQLRTFAYELYRKNSFKTWGDYAKFSGSPVRYPGVNSLPDAYTRSLLIGVSVTLREGRSVSWGFDLLWSPTQWMVTSEIELATEDEDVTIRQFPNRSALSIADCIVCIQEATSELIATEDTLSNPRILGN